MKKLLLLITAIVFVQLGFAQQLDQKTKTELKEFMDSMVDSRDGKTYKTIIIGSQTWFAENLNYKTGKSWCYNENSNNCPNYGRLYDWETAVLACPEGWHLPGTDEWKTLEAYCTIKQGEKLKSTSGWKENGNGTDISGFNAQPGGYLDYNGLSYRLGYDGYWWSSSEYSDSNAWFLYLGSEYDHVQWDYYNKMCGYSVRCIKN